MCPLSSNILEILNVGGSQRFTHQLVKNAKLSNKNYTVLVCMGRGREYWRKMNETLRKNDVNCKKKDEAGLSVMRRNQSNR